MIKRRIVKELLGAKELLGDAPKLSQVCSVECAPADIRVIRGATAPVTETGPLPAIAVRENAALPSGFAIGRDHKGSTIGWLDGYGWHWGPLPKWMEANAKT